MHWRDIKRIRGGKLERIRKRWFDHHPLCVICERAGRVRAAVELDHILALHLGGADDDSNRQGLCKDCHLTKTLAERGAIERTAIGVDGWPVEKG